MPKIVIKDIFEICYNYTNEINNIERKTINNEEEIFEKCKKKL